MASPSYYSSRSTHGDRAALDDSRMPRDPRELREPYMNERPPAGAAGSHSSASSSSSYGRHRQVRSPPPNSRDQHRSRSIERQDARRSPPPPAAGEVYEDYPHRGYGYYDQGYMPPRSSSRERGERGAAGVDENRYGRFRSPGAPEDYPPYDYRRGGYPPAATSTERYPPPRDYDARYAAEEYPPVGSQPPHRDYYDDYDRRYPYPPPPPPEDYERGGYYYREDPDRYYGGRYETRGRERDGSPPRPSRHRYPSHERDDRHRPGPRQSSRSIVRGSEDERKRSKIIWAGNLPYSFVERDVREMFEPYGRLVNITMPMDRYTGKNKGFAFVEFEDRRDAEDAFDKYRYYAVEGRKLKLDWDVGLQKKDEARVDRPSRGRSRSPMRH